MSETSLVVPAVASKMAIEFHCPFCDHFYRLKDEFAGKKATCKNSQCRQVISIPRPLTIAELEAAALSALADEAPKQQEQNQADKVIEMTCTYCEHKWTEPFAKAGKNTLCPNPECRQRLKVPEPKEEKPLDWREGSSKLPRGAKVEELEGVQDTTSAGYVKAKSLQDADATGIELEPRTLKQKAFLAFLVIAPVALIAGGIWYLNRSVKTNQDDQLVVKAREEFDGIAKELPAGEADLQSAILRAAAAEYALRKNKPEELKNAHRLFVDARSDVRKAPPGPVRNALAAEMARSAIGLGGTPDQEKEQIRYRWRPETETYVVRANERSANVHEELRQSLALLDHADFDFRISVARQVIGELVKKGQADFAAEVVPGLFKDPEKDEGRAVVALELYQHDKGSTAARKIAEDLKVKLEGQQKTRTFGNPFPASAQTLFTTLALEKAPEIVKPPPGGTGNVTDSQRLAYVGILLLKQEQAEAIKLAQRPGDHPSQLKALVLCAEWMNAPAPAFDAAFAVINTIKGTKNSADAQKSQSAILRLAQIAAARGTMEQAKQFAEALADEGLKAWAKGDVVHHFLVTDPKQKADESWIESPDVKQQHAGHAWGRLWIARRNSMLSGDLSAEKKQTSNWPTAIHPFALAGIALGLQDRDVKK